VLKSHDRIGKGAQGLALLEHRKDSHTLQSSLLLLEAGYDEGMPRSVEKGD